MTTFAGRIGTLNSFLTYIEIRYEENQHLMENNKIHIICQMEYDL
jgi:hypothetical protein